MRKPKTSITQAKKDRQAYIRRELTRKPPTPVLKIAAALEVSPQRVYQIKKEIGL